MTPSSPLEVNNGLNVSTGDACAGFKDHLCCAHTIKRPEHRREAGPKSKRLNLYSLQPESIMLRSCQAPISQTPTWATPCSYLH